MNSFNPTPHALMETAMLCDPPEGPILGPDEGDTLPERASKIATFSKGK